MLLGFSQVSCLFGALPLSDFLAFVCLIGDFLSLWLSFGIGRVCCTLATLSISVFVVSVASQLHVTQHVYLCLLMGLSARCRAFWLRDLALKAFEPSGKVVLVAEGTPIPPTLAAGYR